MEQIFIFIIVALFWAAKAWWNKQQEKLAAEELDQRERAERSARPSGGQGTPAYAPDQRYKDIQEEIRRRIAERQGQPTPAPQYAPPPQPMAQPPPPRPIAPPPIYKPSPSALPPIRPAPMTPVLRPKPAHQRPAPHPEPVVISAPIAIPLASAESKAYAQTPITYEAEGYPDEATAYALPVEQKTRVPGLNAALASPSVARQAFLLREIFDKPLCLRSAPGGHQDWN